MCDRIVVLIDMDCFYCQVEARLNPSLKGKPLAVVQYNQWKGGGIIAVNYEAREFGVTRHLRGDEAKQKCQDIVLIHVPAVRGKADLTKYRDAGREVVNVLCQFSDCVERASVDEAYLDITSTVEQRLKDGAHVTPSELQHTFVVGLSDADNNEEESRSQSVESWLAEIQELQDSVQLKLAIGAALVEEMRAAVKAQTGFECSAGIAHNKILALRGDTTLEEPASIALTILRHKHKYTPDLILSKLACGLHKPNRQTVLPQNGVNILYQTLPIKKIRSLGGKFGDVVVDQLGCTVMADLAKLSEKQLQQKFDDKTGTWLYNIARGIDNERVTQRLVAKSIGCCKKFPGKQALGKKEDIEKWLFELASEVSDRLFKDLQENKRRASLLTVSYSQDVNGQSVSSSRSGVLASYEPQKIVEDAMDLMKKSNTTPTTLHWNPPLKYLGISVGKFSTLVQAPKIDTFFKNVEKKIDADERTKLKCNVISNTRNEYFGSCVEKENKNNQERIVGITTNLDKSLGNGDGSDIAVFENKKVCYTNMINSGLGSVITHEEKQTETNSGNENTIDERFSSISESKKKILAKVSSESKSRSFFLNYLRTKQFPPSEGKSNNSSLVKSKIDGGNSIVESCGLHLSNTSTRSEVATATVMDKIAPVQGPSVSKEREVEPCIINVHEIFPDLSQADSDVVELLPVQMRDQIKARKLEKQQEKPSTSKILPVKCSKNKVASSGDSCIAENVCMNNVSVTVDVHRNLSLEYSCASDSVDSSKQTKSKISITNSCLLSSLQEDETVNLNKQFSVKRFSPTEIPFTNVDDHENNSSGHPDKIQFSYENVNGDTGFDNDTDSNSCGVNLPQFVGEGKEVKTSSKICGSSKEESISYSDDIGGNSIVSTLRELCPECNEMVPLKDFPEHVDFHFAQNLQKELNSVQVQRPAVSKSPVKRLSGTKKRGRPAKNQGSSSADKKMRVITTFFAPR